MMGNATLNTAKLKKNDEFYTLYEDVEAEVSHYVDSFKDKTVYCNCDDPRFSNFFRYFVNNFNKLKLKKLICTGYGLKGMDAIGAVITNVPDGFELKDIECLT